MTQKPYAQSFEPEYFNQLLIANYPLENYLEEWHEWVIDDPLKDIKYDVVEEEITE